MSVDRRLRGPRPLGRGPRAFRGRRCRGVAAAGDARGCCGGGRCSGMLLRTGAESGLPGAGAGGWRRRSSAACGEGRAIGEIGDAAVRWWRRWWWEIFGALPFGGKICALCVNGKKIGEKFSLLLNRQAIYTLLHIMIN